MTRYPDAMRVQVVYAAALALAAVAAPGPGAEAATRPNVVVIVADDLGYSDLGVQGGKLVPTPHIDSIARDGVRFTDGYVPVPICSPSRAGLITGRYPERFGHEYNVLARQSGSGLPLSERTLVERIHELGYATTIIGKWHLGGTPEFLPMRRGFDEFYGTLANTPYFHPPLVDSRLGPVPRRVEDDTYYTTEAYAERAVGLITSHADRPFFLYLAFNACHTPVQAPERYTSRFAGVEDPDQRLYAAALSALDDAVGSVLAALRQKDLERSTLVFFLSDNGGPTDVNASRNVPLKGRKGTTWEGGIRVPFLVRWTGRIQAGTRYDEPVISLDVLATAFAAAGGNARAEWKLDGVDLLPHLTGKQHAAPHAALFWRFGPQWAVRMGNWKLVQARDLSVKPEDTSPSASKVEPRPWLIDLTNDLGEERDLSPSHPEKAEALRRAWEAWNRGIREPASALPPQRGSAMEPGSHDGE